MSYSHPDGALPIGCAGYAENPVPGGFSAAVIICVVGSIVPPRTLGLLITAAREVLHAVMQIQPDLEN